MIQKYNCIYSNKFLCFVDKIKELVSWIWNAKDLIVTIICKVYKFDEANKNSPVNWRHQNQAITKI